MYKKKKIMIRRMIAMVIFLALLNAGMLLWIYINYAYAEDAQRIDMPLQTTACLKTDDIEMEPQTVTVEVWQENEEMESDSTTELQETTEGRKQYKNVPMYFQTDYPNDRYGNGTVKSSGCSITSLAMVATYMTGHDYYPDELADYFGGYGENNVQRLEYASDMLQLPWKKAVNIHEVIEAVNNGNIAILMMNQESIFTDSQHFIVIAGKMEDGKYIVNDPYEPNYEKWDLRRAFREGFEEGDLVYGYGGGWIYEVNTMPENPYIYVEEKPYVEPRYPEIELTWEEQQLLAKVIWVEARGEPAEGQQAIAEIVFNRMLSEDFPDRLRDVIYEDDQFRSTKFLDTAEPNQAQYDAIDDALDGPYILPIGVVHFATYPVNENIWGSIGGHVFCYQWGDENVDTR